VAIQAKRILTIDEHNKNEQL